MSSDLESDPSTDGSLASAAHEFNDQWVWSDAFTRFVRERIPDDADRTLKVCTGYRDICDVNVDIDLENTLADRKADMFDLPDQWTNEFDATVSDPPWNDFSDEQKATLVGELVRVTKPGGTIILNARFFPDHTVIEHQDFRVRQEDDYGGNTSLAVFSVKDDWQDIYRALDYDALPHIDENTAEHQRRVYMARIQRRADALGKDVEEVETDPQAVDWGNSEKTCPMCGFSGLQHTSPNGRFDGDGTYVCEACDFPAIHGDLDRDLDMTDVRMSVDPAEFIEQLAAHYSEFHDAVEQTIDAIEAGKPVPTHLPSWMVEFITERLDRLPDDPETARTERESPPASMETDGSVMVNVSVDSGPSVAAD